MENESSTEVQMPQLEVVKKWVRKDLDAAIYFMTLLRNHPEILDEVASLFYQKAVQDQVDKSILNQEK